MTASAVRRVAVGVVGGGTVLLLSGCDGVTDPAGPQARRITGLWWFLFGVSAFVVVLVTALVVVVVVRRHRGDETPAPDHDAPAGLAWVTWGGVVLPALLLPLAFGLTLWTMAEASGDEGRLVVEVTGRQWFWDVDYPDAGAEIANEIHIPVGEPVELRLHSDDVIHSFWVPELGPKVDLVPGQENRLVLEADEAGTYRGRCAEFCGLQHAHMAFVVVAEPPDDFEAWLDHEADPAPLPVTEAALQGQEVFFSSCTYCHTVRGTVASGDLGPDLTHLAGRQELAAGTIPNTRGHLAGWILDPQGVKPGNHMPPIDLTGEELQQLLDYLETLE